MARKKTIKSTGKQLLGELCLERVPPWLMWDHVLIVLKSIANYQNVYDNEKENVGLENYIQNLFHITCDFQLREEDKKRDMWQRQHILMVGNKLSKVYRERSAKSIRAKEAKKLITFIIEKYTIGMKYIKRLKRKLGDSLEGDIFKKINKIDDICFSIKKIRALGGPKITATKVVSYIFGIHERTLFNWGSVGTNTMGSSNKKVNFETSEILRDFFIRVFGLSEESASKYAFEIYTLYLHKESEESEYEHRAEPVN